MTSKEALYQLNEIALGSKSVKENNWYYRDIIEKDLEVLFELIKRLSEIYEEIPEKLKFIQWKIDIAKKDTPTEAYSQGEYDTLDIVNRVYIDDLVTIASKLWSKEW